MYFLSFIFIAFIIFLEEHVHVLRVLPHNQSPAKNQTPNPDLNQTPNPYLQQSKP